MHVDPVIREPTRKPTHGALRVHGSAVHVGGVQAVRLISLDCMRPTTIQVRVLRCRRSTQF
jgi:hypothetical protein